LHWGGPKEGNSGHMIHSILQNALEQHQQVTEKKEGLAMTALKSMKVQPYAPSCLEAMDVDEEKLDPNHPEGFIGGDKNSNDVPNVLFFAKGLSAGIKSAVMKCQQLAQRVAEKKVGSKRKGNRRGYFEAYREVMENVGFVIGKIHDRNQAESAVGVTVSKAVVTILASLLPAGAAATIAAGLTSLAESADDVEKSSEIYTNKKNQGDNSIILNYCDVDGQGDAVFTTCYVTIKSESNKVGLFWNNVGWRSKSLGCKAKAVSSTFDLPFFKKVESMIDGKLGRASQSFFAKLKV